MGEPGVNGPSGKYFGRVWIRQHAVSITHTARSQKPSLHKQKAGSQHGAAQNQGRIENKREL
jgi:hypothetical protein